MRYENFGNEPKETLLDSKSVALATLMTVLSELSGQVINVTMDKQEELIKLLN